MKPRFVTIEFTTETKDEDGNPKRSVGDRMDVDPISANSLVNVKKVAKLVGDTDTKAAAKAAVKAAESPTAVSEPTANTGVR